jgi:hypothetical protein
MAKEEFAKRFAQEELSMKKLGFLPRDFNLKEFLVKSTGLILPPVCHIGPALPCRRNR